MRLVDDEVVDPGLLERDAAIMDGVQTLGEPRLAGEHHLLQALDGQAVRSLGGVEHRA